MSKTIISEEYSTEYKEGIEPHYPVNDNRNNILAEEYRKLAEKENRVIFGSRLAQYHYYDMTPVIEEVMIFFRNKQFKIKNIGKYNYTYSLPN